MPSSAPNPSWLAVYSLEVGNWSRAERLVSVPARSAPRRCPAIDQGAGEDPVVRIDLVLRGEQGAELGFEVAHVVGEVLAGSPDSSSLGLVERVVHLVAMDA